MKKLFTLIAVAMVAFAANAATTIIKVQAEAQPYIYWWGIAAESTEWPGEAMEAGDEAGTWTKTFEIADEETLSIILDKGEGAGAGVGQTEDIRGLVGGKIYTYSYDGAESFEKISEEDYTGEPVVGNQIYFMGTENGYWDPANASASILETETAGIFEGEVTFTPKEGAPAVYFAVYKEMTGDWNTQSADGNRLQPETNDFPVTLDADMTMVEWDGTDAAWMLDGESAGTYLVTVDTNSMTIKLATIAAGIAEQLVKQPTAARFYDLNGRYVGTKVAQKGIYICNGKKYVVK